MKTPLSWIKEYTAIADLNRLVEKMNQTGTTVERTHKFGEGLGGIIIGQIQEVRPHPNADKLQIAQVKLPSQTLEIVCGAKNIAPSQKVPVAPVGSSVPHGPGNEPMKIERVKIRGVESNGMLCSAKELGLGDDYSGILILNPKSKIGSKLTDVLNLPETILETEVTTNRSDELSVYGVAREISAILKTKLKPLHSKEIKPESAPKPLKITADAKLSPRYSAVVVSGVKLAPSPTFIQMRLRESGMRPINNVVDITNYVMLLMGQPLHAFDYDKLENHEIIVRESKPGEKVETLDGEVRQLGYGTIVIADPQKVLGLAGVMGGKYESVTEETTSIVLESAVFDPRMIRTTVMKFALRSEASHRFERGVDPTNCVLALQIAVLLLEEYADAKPSSEVADFYPSPLPSKSVTLTSALLDRYLGYHMPLTEAIKILKLLGFKKLSGSASQVTCLVPSWRARDVSIEEDLIEEVARISGYDKIPEHLPSGEIVPELPNSFINLSLRAKEHLSSIGYSEVYTSSLVPESWAPQPSVKIANPISNEWEYLRRSLIPGVAATATNNLNWSGEFRIFELSKIYLPNGASLPKETNKLVVVGEDFYELKGVVESLRKKINLEDLTFDKGESNYLEDAAVVKIGGSVVGEVGSLKESFKHSLGLKKNLYLMELDFDLLSSKIKKQNMFTSINKYPSVKVDLSALFDLNTKVGEIVSSVKSAGGKLLVEVQPLDIFTDDKLGENKKSVSLRLLFQSDSKTLTDSEVRLQLEKIHKALKTTHKAQIR